MREVSEIERAGARPERAIVVAAVPLKRRAREFLSGQLGDGFELVDIRDAGEHADVVLCPPCSPQAITRLTGAFPDARLVVMELQDLAHGIDIRGPVGRALDAGAAAYYIAPSAAALGEFLRALDERARPDDAVPVPQAQRPAALPTGTALDDAIIRHVDAALARRRRAQS